MLPLCLACNDDNDAPFCISPFSFDFGIKIAVIDKEGNEVLSTIPTTMPMGTYWHDDSSKGLYPKDYTLELYMDDHFEWKEWDFKSQDDFENAIVEYLCKRINRTIKTVTEMKRHKYIRVTEYTLNKETNEWILTSDEKVSNLIMRLVITEDSFTEIIKEYHL